jgi:hypothetical protein
MRTADNRDGTFTNPLIFADYPAPGLWLKDFTFSNAMPD